MPHDSYRAGAHELIDKRERSPFAVVLDTLFQTTTGPDGKPLWSSRSAAKALTERECPISHTKINMLRRGTAEPRLPEILAFAELFGVAPDYFLVQSTSASSVDAAVPTAEGAIGRALTDTTIRTVAFRMHTSGMSDAGKAAIAAMVEYVLAAEQQARELPSPDQRASDEPG